MMNTYIPPLLCRRPLLPEESLLSYLLRLALANGYIPPTILTRFCQRQLADHALRDNLDHPQRPETFALLAALTGCSPRELAAASTHFFAQSFILNPEGTADLQLTDGTVLRRLPPHSRARFLWPVHQAQFCPYCLQEAVYHRRIWLLRDVFGCLKHQCMLVQYCEYCAAAVTVPDVVRGQCPRCRAPLSRMTAAAQPLTPLGLFAQHTLQTWWGSAPATPPPAAWTLPPHSEPALHLLFHFLRISIEARWGLHHHYARTLTNQQRVQSQVFQALVNWPQGFYAFLHDCLEYEVQRYSYRYGYNFEYPVDLLNNSTLAFWACGLPRRPDFDFVQAAIDQFLVTQDLEVVTHCANTYQEKTFLRINVRPERTQLAHAIIFRDRDLTLKFGSLATLTQHDW